jgi:hypothetical protein
VKALYKVLNYREILLCGYRIEEKARRLLGNVDLNGVKKADLEVCQGSQITPPSGSQVTEVESLGNHLRNCSGKSVRVQDVFKSKS